MLIDSTNKSETALSLQIFSRSTMQPWVECPSKWMALVHRLCLQQLPLLPRHQHQSRPQHQTRQQQLPPLHSKLSNLTPPMAPMILPLFPLPQLQAPVRAQGSNVPKKKILKNTNTNDAAVVCARGQRSTIVAIIIIAINVHTETMTKTKRPSSYFLSV